MAKVLVSESNLTNIANAIRTKNGSSDTYTPAQMATAIGNISTGITPTGSISITENDTYDVTNYASAVVNVPTGSSSKYGFTIDSFLGDVDNNGVLQGVDLSGTRNFTISGFSDVGNAALTSRFQSNPLIQSAEFSDVTKLSGNSCLRRTFFTSSLTTLSFPLLETITGNYALEEIVRDTSSLTSITFPSLKSVSGNYCFNSSFSNCSSLTTVNFPLLEEVSGQYAFYSTFFNCSGLTSITFPSLKNVSGSYVFPNVFSGCRYLTTVSFPLLEDINANFAFYGSFSGCTSLTTVNFPSLKTIGGQPNSSSYGHFKNAVSSNCAIISLTFPELEEIYCTTYRASESTFYGNNRLEKIYFPKLHTISQTGDSSYWSGVDNLFSNCTSLTEIHFAAANQSAIEALRGYSTKWAAPSGCQILFDL